MPLAGRVLTTLLAGRAVPRARRLLDVARLAEAGRDLRDGLDDLEAKVERLERLAERVGELERRADDLLGPTRHPRGSRA